MLVKVMLCLLVACGCGVGGFLPAYRPVSSDGGADGPRLLEVGAAYGAEGGASNGRPRIADHAFTQEGHGPAGPAYYVTVTARVKLCDDAPGTLTALVRERLLVGTFEEAQRRFTRRLVLARPGCAGYTLRWRVGDRFFGVGWYVVNVRLRDAGGLESKPVGRSWLTRD